LRSNDPPKVLDLGIPHRLIVNDCDSPFFRSCFFVFFSGEGCSAQYSALCYSLSDEVRNSVNIGADHLSLKVLIGDLCTFALCDAFAGRTAPELLRLSPADVVRAFIGLLRLFLWNFDFCEKVGSEGEIEGVVQRFYADPRRVGWQAVLEIPQGFAGVLPLRVTIERRYTTGEDEISRTDIVEGRLRWFIAQDRAVCECGGELLLCERDAVERRELADFESLARERRLLYACYALNLLVDDGYPWCASASACIGDG
jgi:hypothetical protein